MIRPQVMVGSKEAAGTPRKVLSLHDAQKDLEALQGGVLGYQASRDLENKRFEIRRALTLYQSSPPLTKKLPPTFPRAKMRRQFINSVEILGAKWAILRRGRGSIQQELNVVA